MSGKYVDELHKQLKYSLEMVAFHLNYIQRHLNAEISAYGYEQYDRLTGDKVDVLRLQCSYPKTELPPANIKIELDRNKNRLIMLETKCGATRLVQNASTYDREIIMPVWSKAADQMDLDSAINQIQHRAFRFDRINEYGVHVYREQ